MISTSSKLVSLCPHSMCPLIRLNSSFDFTWSRLTKYTKSMICLAVPLNWVNVIGWVFQNKHCISNLILCCLTLLFLCPSDSCDRLKWHAVRNAGETYQITYLKEMYPGTFHLEKMYPREIVKWMWNSFKNLSIMQWNKLNNTYTFVSFVNYFLA